MESLVWVYCSEEFEGGSRDFERGAKEVRERGGRGTPAERKEAGRVSFGAATELVYR